MGNNGTGKVRCALAVSIALFALLVFSSSSSSAAGDPLTLQEREWLNRQGELQIGAFNDYPPFGFVDAAGEAQGMSIDFWRLLASKLGFRVKFHPRIFAQQLEGLKNGSFDSLAGIFPLEERRAHFAFAGPYAAIRTRIYVRPRYTDVQGLKDLPGLKLGVVSGDSSQVIAHRNNLVTFAFGSYPDALRALAQESIDAVIMDELVAEYYTARLKLGDKIRRAGNPVDEDFMTLPVAKENTVLLSILRKGIFLVSTEEWQKIREKWSRRP